MAGATAHSRRALAVGWGLLLASSAFYFLGGTAADNDLWGHVLFGKAIVAAGSVIRTDPYSYTVPAAPWVNHEWLSQVVLYGAYAAGGGVGLWALKLVVGLATFVVVSWPSRGLPTVSSPWISGLAELLVVVVLARGFAIRPQIFTYFFFAVLLRLADRAELGRGAWLWVPLLFVPWANFHGGFVLGLGALGVYTASALTIGPASGRVRALGAFALATAAVVINPFGWRLLPYIATELTFAHPITEWQPVALGDIAQATFIALAGLFVVTLPFGRLRDRPWTIALALIALAMALRHQRHTAVFALAVAAPLRQQLGGLVEWWRRRQFPRLSGDAAWVVATALAVLAISQLVLFGQTLVRDRFRVVYESSDYPVAAVRVLADSVLPSLNLAVPLDWGEYVLWHLGTRLKVSLDGRFATVYSEAVVRDNFAFFAGEADWDRLLTFYPTDAALVPRGGALPLWRRAGWSHVWGDEVADLFIRSDDASPLTPAVLPPLPASLDFP